MPECLYATPSIVDTSLYQIFQRDASVLHFKASFRQSRYPPQRPVSSGPFTLLLLLSLLNTRAFLHRLPQLLLERLGLLLLPLLLRLGIRFLLIFLPASLFLHLLHPRCDVCHRLLWIFLMDE